MMEVDSRVLDRIERTSKGMRLHKESTEWDHDLTVPPAFRKQILVSLTRPCSALPDPDVDGEAYFLTYHEVEWLKGILSDRFLEQRT